MGTSICAVFLGLLAFVPCQADDVPPPPDPVKLPADSPDVELRQSPVVIDVPFGKILKEAVLANLPRDIVVQKNYQWGHQAHVPSIQGVRLIEVMRNHGNWEKMKIICRDVPNHLQLVVDNMLFSGQDRMAFTVHVGMPAEVEFDKQIWQNGLQVFAGHSRARMWFETQFVMEGSSRAHDSAGFKLCHARIRSCNFVAEHVNGVGGDLAKMFGGNFHHTFKQYQARFEQDMMAAMRDAMLKAGDSREVAVSWSRLLTAITVQSQLAQSPYAAALPAEGSMSAEPSGAVTLGATPCMIMSAASGASVTIDFLLNGRRSTALGIREHSFVHEAPTHSGSSASSGFSVSYGSSSHSGHSESSGHGSSEHSESASHRR